MTTIEILNSSIQNLKQTIWIDKNLRAPAADCGRGGMDQIIRLERLEAELIEKENQLKQIIIVEEHEARCAKYYLTKTHA